ncbi:MAG: nuclear transport factor 2 family protein [Dehalococcoidia bacterium]
MNELIEIEAIKRLKYKYLRCVDSKNWGELEECFAEDASSSFAGGAHSYQGRDAIIAFLKEGLPSTRLSMHQGHQPEIELLGETSAKATWALEDYLIDTEGNWSMRGAAFYHDEYAKIDGEWKIKSTGYERIFEEFWSRADTPSLKITQNMFASS